MQDADRIIVMDEGQVDGFGTHEELLKTECYLPRSIRIADYRRRRF
ncbi:MAG: hypothetical protein ACLR2O_17020 [Coprococcus sp.]